jgi:hypothetical protein
MATIDFDSESFIRRTLYERQCGFHIPGSEINENKPTLFIDKIAISEFFVDCPYDLLLQPSERSRQTHGVKTKLNRNHIRRKEYDNIMHVRVT